MIGFYCTLFTLITITIAQQVAPAPVAVVTATCTFGGEAFLGFVGTVTLTFGSEKRAAKNDVKAAGKVNNNPAKKWAPNQNHGVQVHDNSDISGGICGNIGGVFDTWGDAETDDNGDLVFAFDIVDNGNGNVDPAQLGGRTLVIQRNSSEVDESANANVACCVITLVDIPMSIWTPTPPTPPPVPPTTAWPYPWPQDWTPPPGCSYIPASYVAYQATTTTTTTTTTYYYVTTTTAPPPPATKYDPYAPALAPPPPVTTYQYTTPAPTTAKATAGYCWNCPYPDMYGTPPDAAAYYYVPCAAASTTAAGCVPSYYQPHCPASTSVLAMFAVLVAFLALLL